MRENRHWQGGNREIIHKIQQMQNVGLEIEVNQ
jgi:hypothetical protein